MMSFGMEHAIMRNVNLTTMSTLSRPYLTTLTPLRGIAALIVVIFHSNLMFMAFMPIDKPHVVTSGWLWVDFFFVLSGFIIAYVYGENFKESVNTASYWKYIKARFARVYPLHFITMIWSLICALIIIHYADGIHPFFWAMLNPLSAIPSLFLVQSLGLYISAPLNTPAWSLSTEWWMYMIFPFLVPFFQRITSSGKVLSLVGIVGLYLFVKYYLGAIGLPFPGGSPSINVVSDFGVFRCLAGFLLGMLLFSLYQESVGYNFFKQNRVFVVFFVAALIAMQLGAEDILVIALFPFIILSAAYNRSVIKKILEIPVLQRLGDWSFSVYMVHVPIIYVFWIYQTINDPLKWSQFPPNSALQPNYTTGLWMCFVIVGLTLLFASLTYKYIEVPARTYLNKRFGSKVLQPIKVGN
jgi:peptidoglycan/LPS O-acetylase OafA/YrhL